MKMPTLRKQVKLVQVLEPESAAAGIEFRLLTMDRSPVHYSSADLPGSDNSITIRDTVSWSYEENYRPVVLKDPAMRATLENNFADNVMSNMYGLIRNHLLHAKQSMRAGMYDLALLELEKALEETYS